MAPPHTVENGGDLGPEGPVQPQPPPAQPQPPPAQPEGQPQDPQAAQAQFNQMLLDAIRSLQITHNQNLQNQSLQNPNQNLQNPNQSTAPSAEVVRGDKYTKLAITLRKSTKLKEFKEGEDIRQWLIIFDKEVKYTASVMCKLNLQN